VIRLSTLFWLVLVSATGFAMFGVKYQVQALEDEMARTRRATAAEEHEIRVLEAEWAYLTRPESLETMNRRFLSLGPISTRQLHTTVADLPIRPSPAPPPPEPVALVAVAEPAPEASPVAIAEASPPPSAPDAVPLRAAEPAAPNATGEPPPAQSALRAMPALLVKPAAAAQLAKAVPAKATARPSPPRRAKSLDDLIAQIMTSR
jgi:cell division protein FtsL